MVKYLRQVDAALVLQRPSISGSSSPFVGRADELARLTAALTSAADEQGSTVFVTGHPGIGKTRLAREALAIAKRRGFRILEGRAFPLESGLAYAPIVDALEPLLRDLDSARLPALVDGLRDLGRLFGNPELPAPSFAEGLGNAALEKTRLFLAVSRLLKRLAQEAPVALFIDDLNCADPATVELLHYLARGLADQPILLLATYSSGALDVSQDMQALVVSLEREGLAEEVTVPCLSSNEVGQLVRGILRGELPEDLLALLDARAGGTPLFVEALIKALTDSGSLARNPFENDCWSLDATRPTDLGPSVRRLILGRLANLTPAERRVLDLISIIGDSTPHNVLRTVSKIDEPALFEVLRRLRAMGLVAEGMDGLDVAYSIALPLIQEVVVAGVPEMERRRAHAAAIEAFESFSEGRPEGMQRLARHYQGAGSEANGDRALSTLLESGERALALYANEEAARHFDAAVKIVRAGRYTTGLVNSFTKNGALLPRLLERLGVALERIGDGAGAVGVWNEALVLLSEGRDLGENVVAASSLRCELAWVEWDRGRFDISWSHLEAGLALMAGRKPCPELIELLFVKSNILGRLGDYAGLAEAVAELHSVAGGLASPRVEAEDNLAIFISCFSNGDVSTARDRALYTLTVAEQAGELTLCCLAHGFLALAGVRMGDHHLMRYHAERGLAVAQRLGGPTREVSFRLYLAYANFMSGAWDESLRCSDQAIALARKVGYVRGLAQLLADRATVLAWRGELSEAEICISEARIALGGGTPADRAVYSVIEIAETALALERRQSERALGIAKGFACPPAIATAPAGLRPASMPLGFELLAEAQVAAGEPGGALETSHKLMALGPVDTPYVSALASRVEGLARQALGQPEAAVDCLGRAHETFVALELPFEAARSLLGQATAAATVQPELASKAAQQSLAVFERLGAQRYAERARRLLRELGVLPHETRRPRLGGIMVSSRELEIAQLVAQGLTTAEIAERLTLSPLTVGTHLHRIYTRLGISSRTALARYVMEAGLL